MVVYGIDPLTLVRNDVFDDYESLLWVERFIEAGEVKMVMGATHDNAARLRPGTMLLHQDSNEPMLLTTRDIKDGQITASGKTLEAFLNARWVQELNYQGRASNIVRHVITNMQNHENGLYTIPNLRVQDYESDTGVMQNEEHIHELKGAYDLALELAKKYAVGIAIKRQNNPTSGDLELVFVVRQGTDRTQPDTYLRFSPKDDTFTNVDEIFSLDGQVDVVLVHAPKKFATNSSDLAYGWWPMSYPDHSDHGGPNGFALDPSENPFAWRIVEIFADDIDQAYIDKRITDYWWADQGYPAKWSDMTFTQQTEVLRGEMQARAKAEYFKDQTNQRIAFDGQVPGEVLKYGRDYHLGDLVVVEGQYTGGRQTQMVSEFVRSSDGTGARSYPTLAQPLAQYDPSAGGGGGGPA